ncbi:PREDICTED: 50S ribosomal protein L19, chloroplastic-like isoform X1 [Camelina sativa]|uniref:50S ribosomal protein L19, chloroplastic-like isoform X1 n=1 Tax=Camelina sativa TaxID=90675 RepID=A0ABM0T224_CAMSA|nr:PREDICTED: 50S ribosomal protein L19, chloroplastic-like isoform X1 [Camelina sativa]
MQSIRSTTRLLLQRHRVSISNTLRFTSSSSSSCGSWSENESRRLGVDSFSSTRAFDSAATYRISSLKNAAFCSAVVPKQNLMYSSRCFSTVGDSVKTTSQVSPEELASDVPQRIKFKRLDKTAKHIMQIVDKEAVEEVRTQREIPRIEPGYLVQLKVEVPENKRRVSIVKGIVIAKRNAGLNSTFRIRRLVAGVGVESMFPLYSPNLREIKVLEKKKVRRAKLYYLREKTNALKKH